MKEGKIEKIELFDIAKKWLEENGYDGLRMPTVTDGDEECGCTLEDFMPCGEPSPRKCEAVHLKKGGRDEL